MRRVTTVLVAAVALLGVAAAGVAASACGGSSVPSDAVATVGDATVTKAEFEQLLKQAQTQMKAQGMKVPEKGTATYDHYVAQIVHYLVQEQVVAQSAKALGVGITDAEVNEQIDQLEQAYGGEQKVLELLKEQGMTVDLLKRSIRSQTLSDRAAEVVTKDAAVSDAEIEAYWEAHKAELSKKKKTATLAKAKTTIEQTLLSAKKLELWNAWVQERIEAIGVAYAAGFDPDQLTPSQSASPAG
jgi:FKBP-type peptidyl-prolyl cis-trans isomerase (trigger factor)